MSATKAEALRLIETLPEDCTYEDIHYHLYVQQKVERGLAAISAGQFVPQDEAEREVERWLTAAAIWRPCTRLRRSTGTPTIGDSANPWSGRTRGQARRALRVSER